MQNLYIFIPKSLQTLCNIYAFLQRNHCKPYAKSMHFRCEIITNLCKIYSYSQRNHYKPYSKSMHFPTEIITNPMQNLSIFEVKSLQTLSKSMHFRIFAAKSIQIVCKIYAVPYRNHYKPYTKSTYFRSEIITNPMQNLCIFVLKSLQTLCIFVTKSLQTLCKIHTFSE